MSSRKVGWKSLRRVAKLAMAFTMFFLLLFSSVFVTHSPTRDWRNADKSSVGIAPLPHEEPRAVVQVYAARTVKWRSYFAVHTWIAFKPAEAGTYTTLNVMGFRLDDRGTTVIVKNDLPDRKWYGAEPELIAELRGPEAEKAIASIERAVATYPYGGEYRAWPGPNSNTFISYIIRKTPELQVELPPHAIGKDWIEEGDLVGWSESGTGVQVSIFGLLGLTVGLAEGIETNIFGMTFGLDFWRPAVKLPLVGRIGFRDAPIYQVE